MSADGQDQTPGTVCGANTWGFGMGRRKRLAILAVLGLTLLNIWMAKYVVRPLKETQRLEAVEAVKPRRMSDVLVVYVEDMHPLQHLQEAAEMMGRQVTTTPINPAGLAHATTTTDNPHVALNDNNNNDMRENNLSNGQQWVEGYNNINSEIPAAAVRSINDLPMGNDNHMASLDFTDNKMPAAIRSDDKAPVINGHNSVNDETIPVSGGNIPVMYRNINVNDGNIPVNYGNIPVNDWKIPVNDGHISVNDETIPVSGVNISVNGGNIPVVYRNIQDDTYLRSNTDRFIHGQPIPLSRQKMSGPGPGITNWDNRFRFAETAELLNLKKNLEVLKYLLQKVKPATRRSVFDQFLKGEHLNQPNRFGHSKLAMPHGTSVAGSHPDQSSLQSGAGANALENSILGSMKQGFIPAPVIPEMNIHLLNKLLNEVDIDRLNAIVSNNPHEVKQLLLQILQHLQLRQQYSQQLQQENQLQKQ